MFSAGKKEKKRFPGNRKRASSGSDTINVNIPIRQRGPHVVVTTGLSVKHLRGTRCPCLLTSDTGLDRRNDGWGTHFVKPLASVG